MTSFAQLGASGTRIVITNAVNRLKLYPGETITENPNDEEDEDQEGEGIQFGTFHHFADAIASDFGFKISYPAISISPIAFYR